MELFQEKGGRQMSIFEASLREIVLADHSCFFPLGSAAAGDDAHDTSTASTSYCGTWSSSQPQYGDDFSGNLTALSLGLLACTSGAASSGPNGTETSTSTSKAFGA
jgi:hypothetical protein